MGITASQQENDIAEWLRAHVHGPNNGGIDVYALPLHLRASPREWMTTLFYSRSNDMPSAAVDDMFASALRKVLKEKGGHITGVQERYPPTYLFAFGKDECEE